MCTSNNVLRKLLTFLVLLEFVKKKNQFVK